MAIDLNGLTDEQKNTIAFNRAVYEVQNESAVAQETARKRLDAVRLAKETLIENKRSLPADQREVTTAEITAFADTLLDYVNQ